MIRKTALCLMGLLLVATVAMAQDENKTKEKDIAPGKTSGAKALSGMSIVGNDEAPKSLYIVPWKSSEIGVETSLNAMLSESEMPVDRDVFKRQLDFYRIRTADPIR